MTTLSSPPSSHRLPLPAFIEEIRKLRKTQVDQNLRMLQPFVKRVLESLLALQARVEQLPDLSNGKWFIQSQFLSARDEVSQQIEIVRQNLICLSVKASEWDDPFAVQHFTARFGEFSDRAMASPVVFQEPYELESILRVPDPLPASGLLSDTPPDSDFLSLH